MGRNTTPDHRLGYEYLKNRIDVAWSRPSLIAHNPLRGTALPVSSEQRVLCKSPPWSRMPVCASRAFSLGMWTPAGWSRCGGMISPPRLCSEGRLQRLSPPSPNAPVPGAVLTGFVWRPISQDRAHGIGRERIPVGRQQACARWWDMANRCAARPDRLRMVSSDDEARNTCARMVRTALSR